MQNVSSPFLTFNNGKKIKIGNYFLGKTIGKGNSAVVKVAVHGLTKQLVAIKIFDKNALDSEKQLRLRREIESMKRLKHQNIIRLYEIMETNKLICLVTEYASNGELYDYIIENKRLSERKAREIFRQILAAVNHCHLHGIVHRDLKVENLLFDSNRRVKLADFGFSCPFTPGELLDVFCGSPPYCAPELYLAKLYEGPKVDIWSLGVVLYVLVCGYLPFDAQSFNVLRSQVISGSYKIPFFLSEDCTNLIKGMLTIDPSKRFDVNDILNHRWLKVMEEESALSLESGCQMGEIRNLKEFRNLITKIENISIEEFEPNQEVLNELLKYNLNLNEVIKSVRNNEFDSNAGMYYLTEAKLINRGNSEQLSLKSPIKFSPLSSVDSAGSPQISGLDAASHRQFFTFNHPLLTSDSSRAPQTPIIAENTPNMSSFYGYQKVNLISDDQESVKSGSSSITTSSTASSGMSGVASSLNTTALASSLADTNSNYDEDEMPPIEELGRDYLSRYNSIRRHTIATNEDNEMLGQSNNIMKSTECLLSFGQGSGEPISTPENSLDGASCASSTIANLSNGFNVDLARCFNLSLNTSNNDVQTKLDSSPYTVRKSSQNELETAQQLLRHHPLHHGGLGKTKKSHLMHTHYCKSKSINSKVQNLNQAGHGTTSTSCASSPSNYFLPPKQYQSYQVGPYLSPPVLNGRRASDGGSNISLFNQIYSLKHSHKQSNDSYSDNVNDIELMGEIHDQQNRINDPVMDKKSEFLIENNGSATNSPGIVDEQTVSSIDASRLNKPRGSITSGIPISTLKSQLTPNGSGTSLINGFNQCLVYQSSEEEPDTGSMGHISSPNPSATALAAATILMHRKSGSRNETSFIEGALMMKNRQREQSFSGTNSSPMFYTLNESLNEMNHRASMPAQFDLISANRSHLETIYKQSIDNSKRITNKETRLFENQNSGDREEMKTDEETMIDSTTNPNFMISFGAPMMDNQIQSEIANASKLTNSSPSTGVIEMSDSNHSQLHMIQEEQQNELVAMMSSESSSLCSSVSTTPRMSRSSLAAPAQTLQSMANSSIAADGSLIFSTVTPSDLFSDLKNQNTPHSHLNDEDDELSLDDRRHKKSKNCLIDSS